MTSILEVEQLDTLSSNASSTLTIGGDNTSTINLGASGKSIVIPSGATITNNGTQTGFGGENTPAFRATRTTNQTLTDAGNTKIQFNTEDFDTDSCYDNATNYRFTPTVAGKYLIGTQIRMLSDGNTLLATTNVSFFKNGGEVVSSPTNFRNNQINGQTYFLSDIMTFNGSSDYVEVYVNADVDSGGIIAAGGSACHFFGYKLIGA
jgi:hypothetical protein